MNAAPSAGDSRLSIDTCAFPPSHPGTEGDPDSLADLVQHVDDVIFWRKSEALNPSFVSPAFERIWGRSCGSAYADPSSWIESIHSEDRERVLDHWRSAEGQQEEIDYRIVRPSGEIRWVSVRTFAIKNAAGNTQKIVGIAKDCTEQKRSENLRAFLAAIVDSSHDSIVGTDLDGRIVSWNRASEELFGYSAEEAIGQHIGILFLRERGSDYVESVRRIRQIDQVQQFESVRVRRDGTPIDVLVILSPIRDLSGALEGVSAIYHDIRSRKLADAQMIKAKEAAEAATRAKSEFLANMSHEIRTPMNGVIGMTSLLLDSPLSTEQRDYAETILISSEALLTIINDILDFSKIEAGKIEIQSVAFDLRVLLAEVRDLLGSQAQQKGIELVVHYPNAPDQFVGDPERIRQVVTNLVGNAVKFTHSGGVTVEADIGIEDGQNASIRVSVSDTGIGIPPEKLSDIFEQFTQADSSITRRYGGTGLGLSISKRLIELMGGALGVDSTVNQGSTFWFRLRLPTSCVIARPS